MGTKEIDFNLQRFADDDENRNTGVIEKEVYEKVTKEIENIGNNFDAVKKQQDEINKSVKKLRDEFGTETKTSSEKMAKLQEDILTRQEAVDKKHSEATKRLDDIEVMLKRPIFNQSESNPIELKEAYDHMIACMASSGAGAGVKWAKIKGVQPQVDEYRKYKEVFEEFLRKDEKLIDPANFKTLSVGVDPHGGYTVTPFMASQILTRMYETDPIRQLADVMSITTDAVEWLVDRDEAGVGWEGETEVGAETGTPDLGKKRIPVNTMYAKPTATQQLLEDSGINIESWLANKIAERMGRFEGAAFVTGDGINKPRGFLTYANGTDWGTVEQINLGAGAALTADGFVNLKYALREEFLNTGTWLMNRLTLRDAMLLKNGAGDYIWKPSMLASDPSSMILGLAVRMSTTMPIVATNALAIAIADWKQAYMVVDRLGITIQRDPYTRKPFVEFYTRKRVGGDIINYDAIKIGVVHV
jgi:HK97 family phage major capsid protein